MRNALRVGPEIWPKKKKPLKKSGTIEIHTVGPGIWKEH
jgi:hypothetical protein